VRGAGETASNGRRREGGARLTRLEVGERPDGRAPPVSDRRKKKREEAVLGRRGRVAGPLGPSARAREKEKAAGLGCLRAEGMLGRREKRKREGEREGKGFLFFLLKFLFKFIFQTFKLQSNKNPCIRIMMHKHLLFLNYFSDV
jgi:hypothetical protein